VILWRLLPWQPSVLSTNPGGALWFPRELQGAGRHDNPDSYGCLYVGESPVSVLAEALAPFRGAQALTSGMLVRGGIPLALAQLELHDGARLIDLDDPSSLLDADLRPSEVATSIRTTTQSHALRLFNAHPELVGLRWWSTIEASLINLTLFDRVVSALKLIDVASLRLDHPAVREAAELLGLASRPLRRA
jgi:hypothetical protein